MEIAIENASSINGKFGNLFVKGDRKALVMVKFMKTYQCIARSGNTGNQIVIFVRALDSSSAKSKALVQAREQFGNGAGSVTIISCNEVL